MTEGHKENLKGIALLVGIIAVVPIAVAIGSWIQGAPSLSEYQKATAPERQRRQEAARRQRELEEATEELQRRLDAERAIPVKIVD